MDGRVVVVGGSMGGLAAAAALAPTVAEVVVVERAEETSGTVAAQGTLPHVMCASGADVLEEFFPGFHGALLQQGAVAGGDDPLRVEVYWHAAGVARRHLPFHERSYPRALCGRRLIEPELRQRVRGIPNVTALRGTVDRADWLGGRMAGVRLKDGRRLDADLVIDATGRAGSFRSAAGLPEPPTVHVDVDLRYVGYVVERRPEDIDLGEIVVVQNTSELPRIGVLLPLDATRWQIALGGYFGAGAPTDPAGAREFAASLADPALVHYLSREFLEEPRRYAFRSSQLRRWERVKTPGYVAVGDAVASFNPIYGQGMSSALLQAKALRDEVAQHGLGADLDRRLPKRLAAVVKDPWTVATGGDFTYSATGGKRPPAHRQIGRYIESVMRRSASDESVNVAWTDVQHLLASPSILFRPMMMRRVLA